MKLLSKTSHVFSFYCITDIGHFLSEVTTTLLGSEIREC